MRVEFKKAYGFDLFHSLDHFNHLNIDVYNMLIHCGVMVLHSRRFVPHDAALITYST